LRPSDAIALIRPALGEAADGEWADFGAGEGMFTEALAAILGDDGTVIAVERDPRAQRMLQRLADGRVGGARVVVAAGDFLHLEAIAELQETRLDGALFANSLHFVRTPELVLARIATWLRPKGRVVVVEYDRATPNRWVPYPLPPDRLDEVATLAGLAAPEVVARRPSAYHREMYCAVLQASGDARSTTAGQSGV
jgi:SAM-dependent methyltransferase